MCNSCKNKPEDRNYFFKCKICNEIIYMFFKSFLSLEIIENTPKKEPFFHNTILPLNQPMNLNYISIINFLHNLCYLEIVPSSTLVKKHVSKFVETAIQM